MSLTNTICTCLCKCKRNARVQTLRGQGLKVNYYELCWTCWQGCDSKYE